MDSAQAAEHFLALFHDVFMRFHERRAGVERELSREALAVLEHLSSTGPLTVTEAARHFDRSQAAMSEIVARLEGRGLLDRFPDERDRRRTLVWLSQEGLAAWQRSQRPLNPELLEAAFESLSSRDRENSIAALRRLLLTPTNPNPKNDKESPS